MPSPTSNISVLQKRPIDPTGPTQDRNGNNISSAYEQNHFYLSNPRLWPNMFAFVIRRHDEPVDHANFLGVKECGVCVKTAKGWRVYPGIVITVLQALERNEEVEHHDYLTVDALLDDGWEVD